MAGRVAAKVRALRIRQGLRQDDLGNRARVSRGTVSRLEAGQIDAVTVRSLRRIVDALGAQLLIDVQWQGAELDRLIDARHAALQEWFAGFLRHTGWDVRAELSFNLYGDRGRYDLLAFHRIAGALLVVEVKTSIGDMQDLLGRLDVKVRVAGRVAQEQGWRPTAVVPFLVLADSSTSRRHVRTHPALFARFASDRRVALAWLRRPQDFGDTPDGLMIFRDLPYAHRGGTIRVRSPRKATTHIAPALAARTTTPAS